MSCTDGSFFLPGVALQKWPGRLVMTVVLVLMVMTGSMFSQVTSGTIFGTVKDASGAVVPAATVTIRSIGTGISRTVTSNEAGYFVVPGLAPTTYTITVEAKGFKKLEKQGVVLSAADKLNAGDLELQVGTGESSVTVTADTAELQLQTNSGERSDLISSKQLNDVSLNGRMVLDYVRLIPGVVSTFDGHASGTGGADAFNINGTRANQHELTIDGASNIDTGNNGGTHVTINTDAIQEVKILTSNYQAEFGKAAGGQVAIVTKGGTSQFHGNARYFHRHEGLNANDWFRKQNQLNDPAGAHNDPILYRYNYVGYQVGGPVIIPGTSLNKNRDKLYFFWNQEFYRQLIPREDVTNFHTPTALERQGDFSQSVDGSGRPIVISGPGVVNNKIDRSLLSPSQQAVFDQVQQILNLYPMPNVSGNNRYNYSTALSYNNPRREDIVRIDYQINSSNRIFGRYIHNSDSVDSPILPWPGLGTFACAGAVNFQGGCTSNHPGWNASLNLTSTIRPTLLNEFSVGPSVTKTLSESVNGNLSRDANGIALPLFYPVSGLESIPDLGFEDVPGVDFGWTYLGATPWFQANTTINLNDNVTWVRNNHTFKFGAFYQRSRKDQIAWGNINGEAKFGVAPTAGTSCPAGSFCGHPYASALLGDFKTFRQASARPRGYFRYNQLEFYVQDTWKVMPRLTLDFGVRFAWMPPQYDAKNQVAIFDPAAYDPANAVTINPDGTIDLSAGGNPLNGIVYTANGTAPDGGWNSRGIMPEPRFGFAFDIFGDQKTILRGGAGMMHDRTQGNLIFNTVFNNPAVVVTPQVSGDNFANLPALGDAAAAGMNSPLTNIFGASRDGQVPTVYSFSLGLQRELGLGTTLDVAYVGTLSRHLVTSRDINAIPYLYAFSDAAQDPTCTEGPIPQQYLDAGFHHTGQCALGRSSYTNAPLVPYKGYDQIAFLEFGGTSNYNSLQVSVQRRFGQRLTFGAAYTWSHSLATANADEDTMDPYVPSLSYRSTSWDRRHVFALNYVYDIPSITKHFGGPKWLSYITDNFQISGITQFMTGTPFDFNNGNDNWSMESGALDGSNMWGKIPYYYSVDGAGNLITPQIGARTRGSRDYFRNGGMQNWDMSLFKNFPLGEQRSLQLRAEAFNVFNHPNFNEMYYNVDVSNGPWQWNDPATPVTATKVANFGQPKNQYSGTGGPRVLQLGAKFYF